MTARLVLLLGIGSVLTVPAHARPPVSFDEKNGRLDIRIDGRPFATYVWADPSVLRPYFAHVRAPDGTQVTRSHPPVDGKDPADHAAMHPGLWLAFGDVGGADFWRNKGTVRHVEFIEKPKVAEDGSGSFVAKNLYLSGEKPVCEEVCRISVSVRPGGYLIDWDSAFTGPTDFSFGDQEEMGLGVRVATPLSVKNGGQIRSSDGSQGEKQVWGKQADWCDYGGVVGGRPVGIALMPHPDNFRRCWFHARDYGLLVANPFGRNAFTKGDRSSVVVRKGETLRLRFGVLVHSGKPDVAAAYKQWVADGGPRVRPATAPAADKAATATERFLGPAAQWPRCVVTLDDVHVLWGQGTAVHLRGSGQAVVRTVTNRTERRFNVKLSAEEASVAAQS